MAERICSTPGCDRPVPYAVRSLCKQCYYRAILPDVERFEKRIAQGDSGCWLWTGQCDRPGKYGRIALAGDTQVYAHRWSYEYHRAAIPEGLEIDHLCRVTLCVNPWHLEPVTSAENRRRRRVAQTHCKYGHEFTEDNTARRSDIPRARICKECRRAARRRQTLAARRARLGV